MVSLTDLGAFLNLIIGGVVVAILTASVAAYRRIKSGAIVDDDAIIARLDDDNMKVRALNASLTIQFEAERRLRWRAEDLVSIYRRQLTDAKITPEVERREKPNER